MRLAECGSMFQSALLRTSQIPEKFGLPSGPRGTARAGAAGAAACPATRAVASENATVPHAINVIGTMSCLIMTMIQLLAFDFGAVPVGGASLSAWIRCPSDAVTQRSLRSRSTDCVTLAA